MHPIIWPEFVVSGTYKSFIPDTHSNNEESFLAWYMHVGMHMTKYLVFNVLTKVARTIIAGARVHAHTHTHTMISSRCPSSEVDSTSNVTATRSLQPTHFLS